MARGLFWFLLFTVGFFVVLEAMLVPAVLYWPDFSKNVANLRAMAPIPVMKQLIDTLEVGGVAAYVTGQHFFKGCNTLGTAAAVLFAMGGVAGEVHRGTFEIWVARPMTRRRILLERYSLGALSIVLPVFLSTLTIPWLLARVGEEIALRPLLLCAAHQCCLLLMIYGITFLFSTIGRHPLPIAFGMLFFTVFEFAVYLVERVTHTSIFRLTDVERFLWIFNHRTLDWRVVTPMLGITVAALGASLAIFERKAP